MNTPLRTVAFALLFSCGLAEGPATAAVSTAPRVTVHFAAPEKYMDLRDGMSDFENERGRESYLPQIREYLEQRAGKLLPAGQTLSVTFDDIDLAGEFEPWHGISFHDVRIVKDIYAPRLKFSFVLADADGRVLQEGGRRLIDGGFQMRGPTTFDPDALRYEKAMLDDWLRRDLLRRKN